MPRPQPVLKSGAVVLALRAAESLLCKPYDDVPVHHALERLHRSLELVRSEPKRRRAASAAAEAAADTEIVSGSLP